MKNPSTKNLLYKLINDIYIIPQFGKILSNFNLQVKVVMANNDLPAGSSTDTTLNWVLYTYPLEIVEYKSCSTTH